MSYIDDFEEMISWSEKDWENCWKFCAWWQAYIKTPEFRKVMMRMRDGLADNLGQKNPLYDKIRGAR